MPFTDYAPAGFFDEMFADDGTPRPGAQLLAQKLAALSPGEIERRQRAAEQTLLDLGITFNVYGDDRGQEKIFPFDVIPRIVDAREWVTVERGLAQRIRALNLFIGDIYGKQRILGDSIIPRELVLGATSYLPACAGLTPPNGVWCHVVGTDLVRHADGRFYVLEDNLRCPSGASYVLQNRQVMKRTFPQVFEASRVRPVDEYPSRLLGTLRGLAPQRVNDPTVVLLTPGSYNSAYFEHSFLAQQMGIELVQGSDMFVRDGIVYMRTTKGPRRVHVIYRRIDDTFLDPSVFRADSMLGVPGLIDAYRRGNVALANAPGNGIADDKAIYAYVPKLIKFYLGEDPILPNVETYVCSDEKERAHVVANIDKMVVKAANESGGYGMLVGPQASAEERAEFVKRIEANPRNYIAQPMLSLSRVPTLIDGKLDGRHVDLRPYVLCNGADDVFVLPGGLTRVALKKGSCVVNSSQGGGSKDTWVLHA
jgi:uncharacterized circularly permuted ATP-grasp superfamily protein